MKYRIEVIKEGKLHEHSQTETHIVEGNLYHTMEAICAICTRWDNFRFYPIDEQARQEWKEHGYNVR